jgi:hypothetical protein
MEKTENHFPLRQQDWVAVAPVHDYNNKQAEGFLNHQPLKE